MDTLSRLRDIFTAKPKREKRKAAQVLAPRRADIIIPDDTDLAREDAVLDFIERKYRYEVNRDTGKILTIHVDKAGTETKRESLHWSMFLNPDLSRLARGIRIRTTTGWLAEEFMQLIEESGGVKVGLLRDRALRISVGLPIRHALLDSVGSGAGDETIFTINVLTHLIGVWKVDPATIGMIHGGILLHCGGALYWNPTGESVCQRLLSEGIFDFQYLQEME